MEKNDVRRRKIKIKKWDCIKESDDNLKNLFNSSKRWINMAKNRSMENNECWKIVKRSIKKIII